MLLRSKHDGESISNSVISDDEGVIWIFPQIWDKIP